MDTGAGRDQVDPSFEPSLSPTENTGHKRKLSSPNDQSDPARSFKNFKVLAKEADRNTVSNKPVKPLAVNKNAQNRQTSLPFHPNQQCRTDGHASSDVATGENG
jgi:hypothetical protein